MPGTDHEHTLFETLRSIGRKETTKVATPDETAVVEDVAPVEEKVREGPSPVAGKVTAANIFRHPDAHPIVLDLMMLRKYGPDWLDWEPETIELSIPHDFGTQSVSDVNLGKINACKALHLVDSFWERWEVFNWVTMGLNGIFPDIQVMQVPTLAQVLVAVNIANRVREDVFLVGEVKLFIQTVLRHENILVPIPPIQFVSPVAPEAEVTAIDKQWDAVRASGRAPGGATVVDEQLRRMLEVHQFLEESRTRLQQQMELVPMSRISETQLEAFRDELRKEASKWYGHVGKAVENFAKRQVHSVTGWKPKGGLEAMGLGAARGGSPEAVAANTRAAELGLTSLPGYAKALWNPKTRGQVPRAAMDQQLKGTKTWEKAVTLGLPAADLAAEAASNEDPENKGRRLGRSIAGTAAGLATGALPFTGGLLAGAGAAAGGAAIGHGVDKLRARRKQPPDIHTQAPPNPEESRGQSGPPVERNMSPSAAGQAPDWGGQ